MMRILTFGAVLWMILVSSVVAVTPDEILDDPALETRARALSAGLRCLVCQNESIDESDAEVARDLRLLVRERLLAGDSDAEVMQYVVDRYGEFVLLKPTFDGANLVLWLVGPAALLLALIGAWVYARGRNTPSVENGDGRLTDEEQARLDKLLK